MGGIDFGNLVRANWGATIAPLPIMVVAFTFHNMAGLYTFANPVDP